MADSDWLAISTADQTEAFVRDELVPAVLRHWACDECICRAWMCPGPDVIDMLTRAQVEHIHNVWVVMLGMLAKAEQERRAHR